MKGCWDAVVHVQPEVVAWQPEAEGIVLGWVGNGRAFFGGQNAGRLRVGTSIHADEHSKFVDPSGGAALAPHHKVPASAKQPGVTTSLPQR